MATFPEAESRLHKNMYICRKTNRKIRLPINKVLAGKFSVRKGMSKRIRPVRKISKK
jgi:hypothetical protein